MNAPLPTLKTALWILLLLLNGPIIILVLWQRRLLRRQIELMKKIIRAREVLQASEKMEDDSYKD